jgi:predicted aspartyl protease
MPPQVFAFTASYNGLSRVLETQVVISQSFDPVNQNSPPHKEFAAIWDTGATASVITSNVVSQCDLKPIGMAKTHTAGGVIHTPVYLVCIGLPNRIKIPLVRVTEGNLGPNADVLIGMDIICMGDFVVTNKDGKTVFSYRMPSFECIDFVKQPQSPDQSESHRISRNALCPCGSGKKYKRCCGK